MMINTRRFAITFFGSSRLLTYQLLGVLCVFVVNSIVEIE